MTELRLPDNYGLALKVYRAATPEDECYWRGCESPATVALVFLGQEPDGDADEAFVFMCRTHMHGFLGHFLDNSDRMESDGV